MTRVFTADKIFTGDTWLTDHAIITEDGWIKEVVPVVQLDAAIQKEQFSNCFIAPAFIDVQVYGAGGKLLSAFPEPATLELMHRIFKKEGTLLFQPTVATNTREVFIKCIDAVRRHKESGGEGVHGIHLEGPWIHPEKRGAHLQDFIEEPTLHDVKQLLHYGKDVITMITLAPERCSEEVIDYVLQTDIVLSIGHSNATYEQANRFIKKGITTATHLFNAMSPLHHRDPGLVGALLNSDVAACSVIPDGFHVHFDAIRLAKNLMQDRLFAITDAVTETNSGPYQHSLSGDRYEAAGTLSGSALSMHKAFVNLVNKVGIEIEEALRMCSLYPARALRIDATHGKIAPRSAGQFVVLDKQLKLVQVLT